MKKKLLLILLISMITTFCSCSHNNAASFNDNLDTEVPLKIGFLVSDLSNTFHQAQYAAAKDYAMRAYGAEVVAYNGAGVASTQIELLDQMLADGVDMASMHVWDDKTANSSIQEMLDEGIVCASFFGPFKGTGMPAVRNDEPGISKQMGIELATAWKSAYPDIPIVMVELGWPTNNEVITGRTNPFVEGVLSVDPNAIDLGCYDASAGEDATEILLGDILNEHPDVNLIYAEASNLAIGALDALTNVNRGVLNEDGTPLTELVCSCDFDEMQFKQIYGNSSLVASLGLSPSETGIARVKNLFDIRDGKIAQHSDIEQEIFCSAYCISTYSMTESAAEEWLLKHWGITVK